MNLLRVEVERIIDLRWRILRVGLPRETACSDGDTEPTTIHLAAMDSSNVVGCASIWRRPWRDQPAWQLRGMAVDSQFRRCGVGRSLLTEIENIVRAEKFSLQLWCNARTPATPFYRRLGWELHGEEFIVPDAGPHYKMSKLLKESPPPVR